jgi:hypothetical protein
VLDVEKDQRLNPTGRRLSPVERLWVDALLTRGRAMMEILESERRARQREAMDWMREAGDYREYLEREPYEVREGALTAAENLPPPQKGIRMYYFTPDQFPEIHELTRRKGEEAEKALQDVLGVISRNEFPASPR